MDTISRENNSMLPVGGIIVGGIALLIAAYAAVTLSQVKKAVAEQDAKLAKIEDVEKAANGAANATDKIAKDLDTLRRTTQNAFNEVGPLLGSLQASVTKLEETSKKSPATATKDGKDKKGGGEVVAGPGEYVVKAGDTSGAKIARDHGVTLSDLQAVNPSVDWNKLKVGQKLKMPQAAAPAPKK